MTTKIGRPFGTPDALTAARRLDIERHVRLAGGISRAHATVLLAHIDRLSELLNEALTNGPDWTDAEWTAFTNAALPLIDLDTVRFVYPPTTSPDRGRATPLRSGANS